MLLRQTILAGICLSSTVQAAVKIYGSLRSGGDYVTCQSKTIKDYDISSALAIFFPGEIIDGSNDLAFREPLACGDEASHIAEFVCQQLHDDMKATCIPKKHCILGIICLSPPQAKKRSIPSNKSKRDGQAKCNEWTNECRNEYQSTSAFCPSGYRKEVFDVGGGNTADVWCSKPCTPAERATCRDKSCTNPKSKCEGGDSRYCTEALFHCYGSSAPSIKMSRNQCSVNHLQHFGQDCKLTGFTCLKYVDGRCEIIAQDFERYVKHIEEATGPEEFY